DDRRLAAAGRVDPDRRPLARPDRGPAQAGGSPGPGEGHRSRPVHGHHRRPDPLAHRERRTLSPSPGEGARRSGRRHPGPRARHSGRIAHPRARLTPNRTTWVDTGRRRTKNRAYVRFRGKGGALQMMLDMTLMMRPFFWLSVAFIALAP